MSLSWRDICLGLAAALAVAWLAARLTPDTIDVGPYAPRSVAAFDACKAAALAAHPGRVTHSSSRVVDGAHHLYVVIEGDDGREHAVVCDGVSGNLLRDVDLDREGQAANGIK